MEEGVRKLSDIINLTLEEESVEILDEYLLSLRNPTEVLSGRLISVFINVLKSTGKHEQKQLHVSCVLACLHHFVKTVTESQKWERVSEGISKLCEIIFVLASSYIKEDDLTLRVIEVITEIVDEISIIVDNMLKFMIKSLLTASLCMKHKKETRLNTMALIGSLLQKSSRGIRTEVLPSTMDQLIDLSNFLSESDDYETQLSVMEILARSIIFIKKNHNKELFSKNPQIGETFKKYEPFLNFDSDCRLFLNTVNSFLGNQQKVFSVSCMVVCANNARLRKPADPSYSDFWVDFNLGSRSVSFYHQPNNSDSWELMTIPEDRVVTAIATNSACQSKSGEKFEAVKFELTIEHSSSPELPEKVKIYPKKDQFIKYQSVISKIFNTKLQLQVIHSAKPESSTAENKSCEKKHEENKTLEEKPGMSFVNSSSVSKVAENEDGVSSDQSESPRSDELDKEGSGEELFCSRPLKQSLQEGIKMEIEETPETPEDVVDATKINLEKSDTNGKLNVSKQKVILDNNVPFNSSTPIHNTLSYQNKSSFPKDGNISSRKPVNADSGINKESKCSNLGDKTVIERCNNKKRENTSVLNSNSKKKRLYSFETSNAEDVIMSSQDQALSVEIPSYKLTKKESSFKPRPNINRKNVTFSYITNKEKEKPAIDIENKLQKQFNFDEPTEKQTFPSEEDSQSSNSSPKLFKDPLIKTRATYKNQSKNKFFNKKTEKEVEGNQTLESPKQKYRLGSKSAYSDFESPAKRNNLKPNFTYGRPKPKRGRRRIIAPIESSDSDSQNSLPPKKIKENKEPIKDPSPKRGRFAARVAKHKIDQIRDRFLPSDTEFEAAENCEDTVIKPKDIIEEVLGPQVKVAKKAPVKEGQGKNINVDKKKATRQPVTKNKKKPEPKKAKKDTAEKHSEEDPKDCLEVAPYEPPAGSSQVDCEDLALDLLTANKDQIIVTDGQSNAEVNHMIRFGKSLIKDVQEKVRQAESLAQKERQMNYTAFDFKIQESCNGLYGNSQQMESVTDKLEKLETMLKATYSLHREIASQITSEASKLEAAKNELVKNLNKVDKTESSRIASIFQGLGGYVRRLVLSYFQGNTMKNAIKN